MTAALEGDKESAEALAKKGNLLSGEKALSAMQKFGLANQVSILCCSHLAQSMNVETKLASSIEPQVLGNIVSRIRSAAEVTMQKMSAGSNLQASQVETLFSSAVGEAIKNVSSNGVASQPRRLPVSMPRRLPVSMLRRLPVSVQRRLPIRHLRWAREVRSVCQPLIWAPLAMWFLLSTK